MTEEKLDMAIGGWISHTLELLVKHARDVGVDIEEEFSRIIKKVSEKDKTHEVSTYR